MINYNEIIPNENTLVFSKSNNSVLDYFCNIYINSGDI